jgi:hypothetical protein
MKQSELLRHFADKHDTWGAFAVFLVDLDRVPDDEVDVIISPVREVEIDRETQQIRLCSAAARPESEQEPRGLLGMFLAAIPMAGVLPADFEMMVEVPISPADAPTQVPELVPLKGVVVGSESEEIWLLVNELQDYPAEVLPR